MRNEKHNYWFRDNIIKKRSFSNFLFKLEIEPPNSSNSLEDDRASIIIDNKIIRSAGHLSSNEQLQKHNYWFRDNTINSSFSNFLPKTRFSKAAHSTKWRSPTDKSALLSPNARFRILSKTIKKNSPASEASIIQQYVSIRSPEGASSVYRIRKLLRGFRITIYIYIYWRVWREGSAWPPTRGQFVFARRMRRRWEWKGVVLRIR